MKSTNEKRGMQTEAIHASDEFNSTSAITPPIWQTTTFRDSPEHFAEIAAGIKPSEYYTRYGNPTHQQVEATLTSLEGGQAALVTSSGMGAVFACVMSLLQHGDHIVAQNNHYAGTTTLFRDIIPRYGIECSFVSQESIADFAASVQSNTKLIYTETPTNPLMQITDLRAIAELAAHHQIISVVDNTVATPVNQRPIDLGIDIVIHSATKYIGGHHDVTAGALISSKELVERIWKFAIVAGATLSPFDGWLLLRGLRTLALRVERHNRSALVLAQFLEGHPRIERVNYPGLRSHPQNRLAREQMKGFTGLLSVELRGGYEAAERFVRALKLPAYAASLGGFETLVVHPAAMWSLQLSAERRRDTGIGEGLVRISVGLEDERDLLADFAQALAACE